MRSLYICLSVGCGLHIGEKKFTKSSNHVYSFNLSHCHRVNMANALVLIASPFKAQLITLWYTSLSAWPTIFNFWHSGTLALSPEHQGARMSEIKNHRLGVYGTEHLKCNHIMTLGFRIKKTVVELWLLGIKARVPPWWYMCCLHN